MKCHFNTMDGRIVPFDRVHEIRLTLSDEDATINKLRYEVEPDFYIVVDNITICPVSISDSYGWHVELTEVIDHWSAMRYNYITKHEASK